jgi:hypothetical protein
VIPGPRRHLPEVRGYSAVGSRSRGSAITAGVDAQPCCRWVVSEHHRGGCALADRLAVYFEAVAHGQDDLQAKLTHSARIRRLCHSGGAFGEPVGGVKQGRCFQRTAEEGQFGGDVPGHGGAGGHGFTPVLRRPRSDGKRGRRPVDPGARPSPLRRWRYRCRIAVASSAWSGVGQRLVAGPAARMLGDQAAVQRVGGLPRRQHPRGHHPGNSRPPSPAPAGARSARSPAECPPAGTTDRTGPPRRADTPSARWGSAGR